MPKTQSLSQPARKALERMRKQGKLPPGRLTVDDVLMALERLERRSLSQLLLRRELRRIQERTPAGSQPASIVEGQLRE